MSDDDREAREGAPYQVRTPRLVLRPWVPEDAPMLAAAYTPETIAHLSAWIAWAHDEPTTLAQKAQRLRTLRGRFDLDRHYVYAVLDGRGELVGGAELARSVGEGAMELGYWVRAERTRQGFATEITRALAWVAFRWHATRRVEIRCDPRNAPSAAIPRALGFTHEGTRRQTYLDAAGVRCDTMIWTMLAPEFDASERFGRAPRAWDVLGEELGREWWR